MAQRIKKSPVSETRHQYLFICPGCNQEHAFNDGWEFNNDYEYPTISPSFLMNGYRFKDDNSGESEAFRCHSFIKNGQIQFLSDCTHKLAGQTLTLPIYP